MPIKSTPCIELKNINFAYNSKNVLQNVNLTINEGEYVGIIGPNGAGKSTLLQIILGVLSPNKGEIKIFQKPLKRFKKQFLLSYVPQKLAEEGDSFPATVEEVVMSGITPKKRFWQKLTAQDRKSMEQALDLLEITHLRNRPLGELSGGEKQRVYMARALAGEAKILLLDEPATGVDIPSREGFYALLKNLNQKYGLTVIFVTHDLGVIANEVGRVVCLNQTISCQGSPQDFLNTKELTKIYGKNVKFHYH